MRRGIIVLAVVALAACGKRETAPASVTPAAEGDSSGVSGVVRDSDSKLPLPNALVVLESETLDEPLETMTNASGAYRFADLAEGTYAVQVLYGQAEVSKIVVYDGESLLQADIWVSPDLLHVWDRMPMERPSQPPA